jgi:hypothetical protein
MQGSGVRGGASSGSSCCGPNRKELLFCVVVPFLGSQGCLVLLAGKMASAWLMQYASMFGPSLG